MSLLQFLQLGLALASVFVIVSLTTQLWRTIRTGRKTSFAPPSGSARKGVWYAFTTGMLPSSKESVSKHIPTFIAGILFHLATFGSAAFSLATVVEFEPVDAVLWIIRVCVFVGLCSGVGLLIKRLALAKMRVISTPDDYLSNLLVDLVLATTIVTTFLAEWLPALYIVNIVLLVYIPLGKIRHCAFFFYTRVLFGRLFGARGVLPRPVGERR